MSSVFFSSSGAALRFLPPGMEWQLCPPATAGLHPPHHAWAHLHPVPQQPKPHCRPPPPPRGPPTLPAHLVVISPIWFPGHGCTGGPHPCISWGLTPRPPAHLQHLPPGRHCASGHRGHQPPAVALPNLTPAGPVQAPISPSLLHRLACLRQFPSQPYQNQPVPLHLSISGQFPCCAAQIPFAPPEG